MSPGFNYASRMKNAALARNITALRKHLKKNQADFAEMFDTAQPTVSKWESGQTIPEGENLSLLVELSGVGTRAFCDTPWSPPKGNGQGSGIIMSPEDFADELGLALIDEVDLALGMGATYLDGTAEVKGRAPFRMEWLRGLYDGPVSALKVVQGRGDSMEPTIRDGDIVLLDTSSRRLDDQDMIWAVSYGDLGMIRRLRRLPSGALLMSPDNPVVRPTEAHDGECHIMGRVIFIGRRMG
jgi:transcriptional regulator with XRE-family HTH domain